MCGFLGVYGKIGAEDGARFRTAASRLGHRGNSEYHESIGAGAALFHHRLAFRDVKAGHQPLTDSEKRATIIFNGELYDFGPLRTELERAGFPFQTKADTEVILASYLVYGLDFLEKLDGEFAFSINHGNRVVAARDMFGVKPIFFANTGLKRLPSDFFRIYKDRYEFTLRGNLHLASEIKGMPIALKWSERGLNRQILGLYEEIETAFENVIALPPGALFTAEHVGEEWRCVIERKISKRRAAKFVAKDFDFETAAKDLRGILAKNVRDKLDSEVPLGAYLSGGVDSRIAAYEMGKSNAEISTFTVGFEGKDFDETENVAKFLHKFPNLKGRVLKTDNAALAYSYPHAIYASELVQPYTNGAAKWWLSRFARRHVRGVLTGDGADELFCGYPSYRYLAWWNFYRRRPGGFRESLYAGKVVGTKEKFWEKGLSSKHSGADLAESVKTLGWAHPLFAQIEVMATAFGKSIFTEEKEALFSYVKGDLGESPLTVWQNYFLHTHFPTHVLNWVGDRMEMANTLEGRPIFLSRSTLDFVRALPDHALVKGMRDKAILRAAYREELQEFAATPKKQFNAPFLYNSPDLTRFLSKAFVREAGLVPYETVERIQEKLRTAEPLERSFLDMLLQNLTVAHMLHEFLVVGKAPERDRNWEERFLDERTENL